MLQGEKMKSLSNEVSYPMINAQYTLSFVSTCFKEIQSWLKVSQEDHIRIVSVDTLN